MASHSQTPSARKSKELDAVTFPPRDSDSFISGTRICWFSAGREGQSIGGPWLCHHRQIFQEAQCERKIHDDNNRHM